MKKQAAYAIVRKAVMESQEKGQPFSNFVLTYKPITEHLTSKKITALLTPENHLGLVQQSIDSTIKKKI